MFAIALVLALGGASAISPTEQATLTPIDVVPTTTQIDSVFGDHAGALAGLAALAQSGSADVGVRVRSLHALAGYCGGGPTGTECGSADPAHEALSQFISDNQDVIGSQVVMLRAAVEAIGPLRVQTDLALLVPLLSHPSRDIRAATAHALRDLCNTGAIVPLGTQYEHETTQQVQMAIEDALRVLKSTGTTSPCS